MIKELKLTEKSQVLVITLVNGKRLQATAACLRVNARDARSRREMLEYGLLNVDPDIRITAINPMGASGVNIVFSDGHDKAIYPYVYLQTLARSAMKTVA